MTKITYLFGAGASAQAIPPVKGFVNGLEEFKTYLEQVVNANKTDWDDRIGKYDEVLKTLIKLIDHVVENADAHETIDTLARKYYLQNAWEEYRNIKIVLASFFLFRQVFPKNESTVPFYQPARHFNIDKRYDSLFAQNLDKTSTSQIRPKSNFNIVTWNYDLQLEFALRNYLPQKSINDIKKDFQIHPNRNSLDLRTGPIFASNNFYVVKLNGNAFFDLGHFSGEKITIYDRINKELEAKRELSHDFILGELLETLRQIVGFSNGGESTFLRYFNFSWENREEDIPVYPSKALLLDEISESIQLTDILIIVGYSFPNFNHDVDLKLFSKSKFKKIIIQDLDPEFIVSRLYSLIPQFQSEENNDNIHPTIEFHTVGPYFPIHY